jgi:hypothetical protein
MPHALACNGGRRSPGAYARLGQRVLDDNTGLTVHARDGLLDASVAWFLDIVGKQGILDMAAGLADLRASVTTALGYADATGVRVFRERRRLPGHQAARHLRLRLRPCLFPGHRLRPPYLRAAP